MFGQAIKKIDKGLYPKAFCKVIPDVLTNDPEYAIVMHADGERQLACLSVARALMIEIASHMHGG
jgi:hypothetical protein